jgi:hypothetical protein|nr:MAG TPA_asm: hypothetical protein [Caudoviricetes sp.]
MTDNKKPSEPVEEERRAELESEIEELERQTERNEAERWARIEKKERAADILSTLSLVFSIIVLLITLAK